MRDLVANIAASLAFRRYLDSEQIPHTVLGTVTSTNAASYPLQLRGRRCFLESSLLFNRKVVHSLCSAPDKILARQAELEVNDLGSDLMPDNDLIVMALVPAIITRHPKELADVFSTGNPACLVHTLPAEWANPLPEKPLEQVALKSNYNQETRIIMGGRDLDGNFQEEALLLPPHVRTLSEYAYQSLAYLSLEQPVAHQIGLSSKVKKSPYIINPGQWGNIWIYGTEIFLAGYLSRAEFRHKAAMQAQKAYEIPIPNRKKRSLPLRELRPLAELFDWAR
jgi:hypothetical protein